MFLPLYPTPSKWRAMFETKTIAIVHSNRTDDQDSLASTVYDDAGDDDDDDQ